MTPPLFDYEVTCVLWRKGTQFVIAEGLGSCSSYETKYKYRQGERKCPSCNQATIIKGKAEYGGGWLCFKKKGGCGAKFEDGDQAIETQTVSRVLNEDMADSKNTILKIAVKRALVSAVIAATRSSGIFTPDMEHAEGSALRCQRAKLLSLRRPPKDQEVRRHSHRRTAHRCRRPSGARAETPVRGEAQGQRREVGRRSPKRPSW